MRTIESLQEAIRRERKQREAFSGTDWLTRIRAGHAQQALQDLIFFTTPEHFLSCVGLLQHEIRNKFEISSEEIQECDLRLLAELVLALCSFLPRWNLQSTERHGSAALTDAQLKTTADTFLSLIGELSVRAPALAEKLLVSWRAETLARLKAERAEDPSGEAQALVGNSIREYLANVGVALAHSHLRRMAEMRSVGETMTELSNDYATFLQYALYLGASFVTCNPPLIDIAWTTDPERWNPVVDEIIASHPDVDDDALARWVTLEIVLTNMRLLRPIFLLTEGRMGCVSLQVNPKKHGDAETMIRDAQSIYDELTNRLEGGVPNVVFKLPGTQAGLTACSTLTKQGIGVNITVNFALFQHLPFAQVIAEGRAIFSCLAHMSGRLAFPVRDELLAKLDELATCGISEAQARGAAAWSGVAVLKRLHRLLTERGYDLTRIKPLVASLRIYEGDGYESLPSISPDITETLGTSILSVFPNIRRTFDALAQLTLDPRRVESPVPALILETLAHSEIFKQAYYVPSEDGDSGLWQPDRPLILQDEDGTAAWVPVRNTLTEFNNSYDAFVQRILERKRAVLPKKRESKAVLAQ